MAAEPGYSPRRRYPQPTPDKRACRSTAGYVNPRFAMQSTGFKATVLSPKQKDTHEECGTRVFARGEDTHSLRLASELAELRSEYVNPCFAKAKHYAQSDSSTAKTKKHHKGASLFWQRNQDLNPDEQSQSLLCYRYTIPLCSFRNAPYSTTLYLFCQVVFSKNCVKFRRKFFVLENFAGSLGILSERACFL